MSPKPPRPQNLTLEEAQIIFKNLAGKKDRYNTQGIRSFCVVLDEPTAEVLKKDKWNVRYLEPREEGDERIPYLNVTVSYLHQAPKITIISEQTQKQTRVTEDNVEILDWADIVYVDMIINPSVWQQAGNSGVKAYLQKMYVIIREDKLDLKYSTLEPVDTGDEPIDA